MGSMKAAGISIDNINMKMRDAAQWNDTELLGSLLQSGLVDVNFQVRAVFSNHDPLSLLQSISFAPKQTTPKDFKPRTFESHFLIPN